MQRARLDIGEASIPTLHAEPRHEGRPVGPQRVGLSDHEGHVRDVEANSGGLVRATLGSAAAAGAILVLFWLPAEYGIDPTGLGRATGLAQMGEIKQQLYAEAAAEDAALADRSAAAPAASGAADPQVLERLSAIEAQVAGVAAIIGAGPATQAVAPEEAAPAAPETNQDAAAPEEPAAPLWRDEVTYTLAPTEGIEVKLAMDEGAVAEFEWTANGAALNHDTHGDGGGQNITYAQGRGVPGEQGRLVAAFSGNHGWFWRNRTDEPVTFTLRTRGDYSDMRTP
jgi:hypothetical protein